MIKVFYFRQLFLLVFVSAERMDKTCLSLNHIETRYRRNLGENFAEDSDKEFWPNFGKRNIVPSQIYIFGISRYRLEEQVEL